MNERNTPYVAEAIDYMTQVGHATNADLLERLRSKYSDLTATTIHRITARLVERSKLAIAPVANGNVKRFDANIEPHDHFHCGNCDMLRDVVIADEIRPILERSIGGDCRISGNLVISGLCKSCSKEK